jgi:hypothetical protein
MTKPGTIFMNKSLPFIFPILLLAAGCAGNATNTQVAVHADPAPRTGKEILEAEALALVARLGHDEYVEREKAQERLEAMPNSVLAAVRAAVDKTHDPEIAMRGKKAIRVLQERGWTWTRMESGTVKDLYGVWGAGPGNIYATGADGTILHYDGTGWKKQESGVTVTLYRGLWGTGPDNIYAGGADGVIIHCDGKTWSRVEHGQTKLYINDIHGTGPDDIYAVGGSATDFSNFILHYDGKGWSAMTGIPAGRGGAIWCMSKTDIYLGTDWDNNMHHYDGANWTTMKTPFIWKNISAIWGTAQSCMWAATGADFYIVRWDGASWTAALPSHTNSATGGMHGTGPNDIFASGLKGEIFHYDGTSWKPMQSGVTTRLSDVWCDGAGRVYIVGANGVILRGGGR